MVSFVELFFSGNGVHRDRHVLTPSFPTRRSSDLARNGDHPPIRHRIERGEERGRLAGPLGKLPAAETHAENAPRLSDGDIGPEEAATILPLQELEMTAGVQDGHRKRLKSALSSLFPCLEIGRASGRERGCQSVKIS